MCACLPSIGSLHIFRMNLTVSFYFLQEEEFTGFGARRGRPPKSSLRQTKTQEAPDETEGAKPLLGKIISKTPKPALIGKIVPRAAKESPVKDKELPKGMIKLRSNQQMPTAKDEQALDILRRTRLRSFAEKAVTSEDPGSVQSQTSVSLTGYSKRDKTVVPLTEIKDRQTSKIQAQGKPGSKDANVDQSQLQRTVKRTRGFRFGNTKCASQEVALTCTSIHKQQRKRLAKGMVASPEAGAEAGSQTGPEAAMPSECKDKDSPEKRRRRRRRKSLYGHRQKSLKNDSLISLPKLKRNRIKRVFYTYVMEPIPTTVTSDGMNEQSQQSQIMNPSVSEPGQENSSGSTPLSARSSRVIKVPKRFLDEEIIPFPKGCLSTWLKSQTKEDEKPSPSHPESSYGDSCQQLESIHLIDNQPRGNISSNLTSHVELYKNLKKLTLKVAEKKKGQPTGEGDHLFDSDCSMAHVKKRRKSKITMEETDTPGVVRKLSVVVNSNVEKPSDELIADKDNSKNYFLVYLVKV